MKNLIITLSLIATAGFNTARAQSSASANHAQITNFIKQAYIGGMSEIRAGNIALKQAKDGGVKSFGSQMDADFTQIINQLNVIVKAGHYKISHKDTARFAPDSLLTRESKNDFDSYYINSRITTDRNMLKLYQDALSNIDDPELQDFIKKTIPILKDHLSSVTALSKINKSVQ
jgi:putative membrane protein